MSALNNFVFRYSYGSVANLTCAVDGHLTRSIDECNLVVADTLDNALVNFQADQYGNDFCYIDDPAPVFIAFTALDFDTYDCSGGIDPIEAHVIRMTVADAVIATGVIKREHIIRIELVCTVLLRVRRSGTGTGITATVFIDTGTNSSGDAHAVADAFANDPVVVNLNGTIIASSDPDAFDANSTTPTTTITTTGTTTELLPLFECSEFLGEFYLSSFATLLECLFE